METLYTCEQVAERYGIKKDTVWGWVRAKKLPAVKIGKRYMIRAETLEALEKQNETTKGERP